MKIVCFVIFTVIQCAVQDFSQESCSSDEESCSNIDSSQLLHSFNLTLTKIHDSVSTYKECEGKSCSCFLSTLTKDLAPFKTGISKVMVDSVRSRGTTYVVFEHKLYRDKECMFPARCEGIEHFLLQIIHKFNNTEMIINTRDWPQISKHFQEHGPVFSFSKTNEYKDIMIPAWSFWKGGPAISLYPTGLGRWDQHRTSLAAQSKIWTWNKKFHKGFFRGSRTSQERDVLVLVSRKFPDLIDAQYTKNQAWKSASDTLGAEPAKEVSLDKHCQYKYLFNFRGVAASFRFKHLFLCGSLVIHFGNEWIEFFYPLLKPWVHYVPMEQNASEDDVFRMMEFLQRHDHIAMEIAENGKSIIDKHLTMRNVKCYWKNLLKRYTKLLRYEVTLDSSLMQIT